MKTEVYAPPPHAHTYTAVVDPTPGGWSVYVPELDLKLVVPHVLEIVGTLRTELRRRTGKAPEGLQIAWQYGPNARSGASENLSGTSGVYARTLQDDGETP